MTYLLFWGHLFVSLSVGSMFGDDVGWIVFGGGLVLYALLVKAGVIKEDDD